MHFSEFTPDPSLRKVVVRLWEIERKSTTTPGPKTDQINRLVPDGNAELVIHLRSIPRRQVEGDFKTEPSAFVFGQLTGPLLLSSPSETLTIGASLRPEALAQTTASSAYEFTNRAVALDDVWGPFAFTLRQRLLDAPSQTERLEILQAALLARSEGLLFEPTIEARAVSLIHHRRGVLTVNEVALQLGIGLRHLQRRFRETVGVSPKTFIRITRLQAVISCAATRGPVCWAALAFNLGFADQAHMINDFGRLVGQSPHVFARDSHGLVTAFAALRS